LKPFLCIDLTTDKKNEQVNGSEFLVQKASMVLSNALETASNNADTTLENSKIPKAFRIIQYISGIITMLIGLGILRAEASITEGYQNAPYLYWTAGVCFLVWLVLWLWGKLKAKTVLETDESTQTFSHLDGISDAVFAELGVPQNAGNVDILQFFYKTKDGNIKVCEKAMQIAQYFNPQFKVFADAKNLYLANLEGKYAFPRSSIVKMHTVKKHIRITGWNKRKALNEGIYKQYKLTADQYGCIHCKYYHILEINHNGESWGIYIPCYEGHLFENLAKSKAQD